jgi:hypothetical protein
MICFYYYGNKDRLYYYYPQVFPALFFERHTFLTIQEVQVPAAPMASGVRVAVREELPIFTPEEVHKGGSEAGFLFSRYRIPASKAGLPG